MPLPSEMDILKTQLKEVQEHLSQIYNTIPRDINNTTQSELMLIEMHKDIRSFLLQLRILESNKQKD